MQITILIKCKPVRINSLKVLTILNANDSKPLECSHITGRNAKWHSQLENIWQFLIRLKHMLTIQPAIPFLDIHPREPKTHPHKNLRLNVHRSYSHDHSRLETAQCPPHFEWVSTILYDYTMESYSGIKSNELLIHTTLINQWCYTELKKQPS